MLYISTYRSDDFLLLYISQETIGILESCRNIRFLDLHEELFILVTFLDFINDVSKFTLCPKCLKWATQIIPQYFSGNCSLNGSSTTHTTND